MRRSSCLVESLWPFAYLWHNALLVDKCLNVYGVLSFIFENTLTHFHLCFGGKIHSIQQQLFCHSLNTRLSCFSRNLSASTRICRCDNVLHLKRKVNCPRLSVLETRLGVLCYHQRVLVPSAKNTIKCSILRITTLVELMFDVYARKCQSPKDSAYLRSSQTRVCTCLVHTVSQMK